MDDTERPDPILRQVPLINNPAFQPPKAITLNANYDVLIPTLSNTVVPPKINLADEEIQAWLRDIKSTEFQIQNAIENDEDVKKYKQWIKTQQIKVAPGFSFDGVMQPHKQEVKVSKNEEEVNELDKVFGKTSI
ncbi:hypothetical protein PICST_29837 [Scheffersomyces stipitis CBS 6054]|uniref:Uncharacterized protein n=1 Tax=Scheffersomyces stipitis (strain ATCC 58785 / CBS 6054 / NBRC 10063 / NRRL Y-11545) TaxID=322104 RepID=A3LP64_PICST|nr:hypothetical protein PICST_29837 [Scheffersomyces stipitis CBS 6054]ABN64441.2 hypothetical protein PICST_29837 [Scheffersomyces stipitis CBS 6054]KAG2735940.1 hypothetical protein G9P44_000030 [Scheffersomyces stipitis]